MTVTFEALHVRCRYRPSASAEVPPGRRSLLGLASREGCSMSFSTPDFITRKTGHRPFESLTAGGGDIFSRALTCKDLQQVNGVHAEKGDLKYKRSARGEGNRLAR